MDTLLAKRRELASLPGRGRHAQAQQWQACPGWALAKVPRQNTGKSFQAVAASLPRQRTGKRSQVENQQGTANVAKQENFKRSHAGNRWRVQVGDDGCSHSSSCTLCKRALRKLCSVLRPTPRCHSPANKPRIVCWDCMLAYWTRGYYSLGITKGLEIGFLTKKRFGHFSKLIPKRIFWSIAMFV